MNPFSRSLKTAALFLIFLGGVLGVLVFCYLPPAAGFQDESAARIVVLHVPMAWLASLSFIISAVYAGRYLRRRLLTDDDASAASAEIGLLCCALATATGSIFARSQWGSWWNWDPRETSIFFLLLIYGAYFSLRGSVDDPVRRAVFSAVYALLAAIVMPFLIFVMPRIMYSLHPKEAHLAAPYWLVLLGAFIGFAIFLTWTFRIRCGIGRSRLKEYADDSDDGSVLSPTLIQRAERNANLQGEVN